MLHYIDNPILMKKSLMMI